VGRSSSFTVDCRFLSLLSSSSSSAISINLRRRSELVEEEVDPEAACKEQAAESFVSLSSLGFDMEKAVS
jgi:rRNA processing protein Krr1/Pno1